MSEFGGLEDLSICQRPSGMSAVAAFSTGMLLFAGIIKDPLTCENVNVLSPTLHEVVWFAARAPALGWG